MGCWNNRSEGHAAVMEELRKRPEQVLILGGDNAYPDHNKHWDIDYLIGEMKRLPNKEKFAAFGNHNLDVGILERAELALHPTNHRWNMPDNYYACMFTDGFAIIVLDTNCFNYYANEILTKPPYSLDPKRLQFAEEMLRWLHETVQLLERRSTPYYLVQHDPIVSHKADKKKRTIVRCLHHGDRILDQLLRYPPLRILCADTHNYQEGDILYKGVLFHQIVSGTGGGKPDKLDVSKILGETQCPTLLYQRTKYVPGYGFVQIAKHASFQKVRNW